MTNKPSLSNIPVWAWVLAGFSFLFICCGLVVGGIAVSVFAATSENTVQADTAITEVATESVETTINSADESAETSTTAAEDVIEQGAIATQTESIEGSDSGQATPTKTQPTPPTTLAPSPTAGTQDSDPGESPKIDALAQERARVESNVVEIRGLEPERPVNPTELTTAELRIKLEESFSEEYSPEEARLDAIAFSAFDFFPRDFDLYEFSLDLMTEQVAGYYDSETDEFVIIGDDEEFDPMEQFVHAHEYVHALQDQHFDLDALADESLDSEASFALRALAEGDATLVQSLYLFQGYFSLEELTEIIGSVSDVDMTILESAPPIMASELDFPYTSGLAFVEALYERGGYTAVDKAWENLPQSTEQILHPERYLAEDTPQLVSVAPLTDTLGLGWQRIDEDIFGEFYLREYLVQQIDSQRAAIAAEGWGGDHYAVYWNEEEETFVMVLRVLWDTQSDSDEFAEAYMDYPQGLYGNAETIEVAGGRCWQGSDVICLFQSGGETLIIRAPNLEIATAVLAVQNS